VGAIDVLIDVPDFISSRSWLIQLTRIFNRVESVGVNRTSLGRAPRFEPVRLGIDLDGVVANFTQGWMDFYNGQHGTALTFADSQNWQDLLTLTHFNTMTEFWRWAARLAGHTVFWHLRPFPDAVESLRALADEGHSVVILTSRPAMGRDDTHDWVKRHRIPAAEVHFLEHKWMVPCQVYLDDAPHLLPDLVRLRDDASVCRYVRPWNRPVDGAIDIHDWGEFRDLVAGLTVSASR